MGGVTHELGKGWKATYTIGSAPRNPEVNELYSNGLHQGVSEIEQGGTTLSKETSVENSLPLKGSLKKRVVLSLGN